MGDRLKAGDMPQAPDKLVIGVTPTAHFGAGAITELPGIVTAAGGADGTPAVLVVTDAALASSPVVATVTSVLEAVGIAVRVFSGVQPNPTTGDLAAGAAAAKELLAAAARPAAARPDAARPAAARPVVVAVGGGSPIDAAKGIALAAVNPQRGRELDYRLEFVAKALPLVAVPTTAGTGAETNAFGVVTDEATHRKFYVGHASTMPAAAILDPDLTIALPAGVTAATGMDALTHALESYLSVRANPWSAGIALQAVRMVMQYLPRAVSDGSDREARAQMLLAAHMAGIAMASTGLGACHAIGHALGGRYNLPHGVALSTVLTPVLAFTLPAVRSRLAELTAALGTGDTSGNVAAAISAVAALAESVGMTHRLADFGIGPEDFDTIAADALDDEVLANAPVQPTAAEIVAMLAAVSS